MLVEVSSFVQRAHRWRCLDEVGLRCDFGALLLHLAPGSLGHKGIAGPAPSAWGTRTGDTGLMGLSHASVAAHALQGSLEQKSIGAS